MDQSENSLRGQLDKFGAGVRDIPEMHEPPKTTLEVLEREQREIYWSQYLRYFLDPSEPHGLDMGVLERVLELVEERGGAGEFEYQSADEIMIDSEVQGPQGNRPDLFVSMSGTWAICFELKVTSEERKDQTIRYANDFSLDKPSISPDYFYYVYISKQSQPSSSSESFLDLSWRELVEVFDEVLLSAQGGATERGMAQLRDFRDTIANEISMSNQEYTEREREKMELYLEYYDEINQARDAFQSIHDQVKSRWGERFLEEYKPDSWTDDWNCEPSKRGLIYKNGWRLDGEQNPVDDRDEAVYRLEFQHFLRKRSTFTEGQLRFRVYTSRHGVPDEYREAFKQLANNEYYGQLEGKRTKHRIKHVTGKKNHAEKYYAFDPQKSPEAAYEALSRAFDEFVELAPVLTEIHRESLERATTR